MTILFSFVLYGTSLLFVAVLVMRRQMAGASRFSGTQRVIASLALVAAVIPGVWLLTSSSYSDGQSLLHANGPIVFIDLLIPIGLALPSVFARSARRTLYTATGALVLGAFCLITGFSIGPVYLPAAALLLVAGAAGLVPVRTS
jgi:hypothetical protein